MELQRFGTIDYIELDIITCIFEIHIFIRSILLPYKRSIAQVQIF